MRILHRFAFILLAVGVCVVLANLAAAQNFTTLYSFTGGTDGAHPYSTLTGDDKGNLYGTTAYGGPSNQGTVFKLDRTGKETVLYSFTGGADGALPYAGLIRDAAGNLYGTTPYGGNSSSCPPLGCGTVFMLDSAGNETVLHSFSGPDGENPFGRLVRDAHGNFYGTTTLGGDFDMGTVFRLDRAGNETVVHSFSGPDGENPFAPLIRDGEDNFYGTTYQGGAYGSGTVFKVDSSGKETVLYSFKYKNDFTDGGTPMAPLIRDAKGNFYGTTQYGGASNSGSVFKLDCTGKETLLHSFNWADGAYPFVGRLIRDAAGNLYGTTQNGGASGSGVIFKIDKTGNETVLYSFTGGADGDWPWAGLIRNAEGNLYGTTFYGGVKYGGYGYGTVFKLKITSHPN